MEKLKKIMISLSFFLVLVCLCGVASAAIITDNEWANTKHPYNGKIALKAVTVQTGTQFGYNYKFVKTTIGKIVSHTDTFVKFRCTTQYIYTSPIYNHIWTGETFYHTLKSSASFTDKSNANTNKPYVGKTGYHRVYSIKQVKKGRVWKTIATSTGKIVSYTPTSVRFKYTVINKLYVSGKLKKTWRGITAYIDLPRYC